MYQIDFSNRNEKWRLWLPVILAVSLYLPSVTYDYTLDDAIVIYNNEFTTQGIAGIDDLFTYDTFRGFFKKEGKEQLVIGGRYRPLTPAMFAIEYQLTQGRPWLSHLINLLLYGLLGLILIKTLDRLFEKQKNGYLISLFAVMIFLAHPTHVEVVANIKGRDEIMALLLGMLSLFYLLKGRAVLSFILLFLALLSKEMALTIVPVFWLISYWIEKVTLTNSIKRSAPLLLASVVYIGLRTVVIGLPDLAGGSTEMMNNPFIKVVGADYLQFEFHEKWATIFAALYEYLRLLFWPSPLTHDYYPRHLAVFTFSDWKAIAGLLGTIALVLWIGLDIKRRSLPAFGAAFYLISLFLISNIFFPIGTHMGERFLFFGSLGWAISIAGLFFKYFNADLRGRVLMSAVLLILGFTSLYRIPVWKSDYRLFTTDVKTSANSAKALNAASGAIINRCLEGAPCETEELEQALAYSSRAIEIHPRYKNAYLIQGNALLLLKRYEEAITSYQYALSYDLGYKDARKNLLIAYSEAARYYGETMGDTDKALRLTEQLLSLDPNNKEGLRLAGVAHGVKGNYQKAISYFNRILVFDPNNAEALRNIGISHIQLGNNELGNSFLEKAKALEK